jgi:hypothetical protein
MMPAYRATYWIFPGVWFSGEAHAGKSIQWFWRGQTLFDAFTYQMNT